MTTTFADLRQRTLTRLGDEETAIWASEEIDRYLSNAYQEVASVHTFYDWVFAENLPGSFSMTQPWERLFLSPDGAAFDLGIANYTYDDELRAGDDESTRLGPAWITCPSEAGLLSGVGDIQDLPATSDLPESVIDLERGSWDTRRIDAMGVREAQAQDRRYELTIGAVYGYLWRKDGIRTLRKVRRPAEMATFYDIEGTWGLLRDPTDLSTDPVSGTVQAEAFSITQPWEDDYTHGLALGMANFTDEDERDLLPTSPDLIGPAWWTAPWEQTFIERVGGTSTLETPRAFGIARRIPGQHPLGPEAFGAPRRPYTDQKNVRLEHWRQGRTFETGEDLCELPDRYASYLVYYAQWKATAREGPGQDLVMAEWYHQRWQRCLARIQTRITRMTDQRDRAFGGESTRPIQRPPRPTFPWAYGPEMR